jgi:gamma-glutamyltranspeptidase/glutathione hydrolase
LPVALGALLVMSGGALPAAPAPRSPEEAQGAASRTAGPGAPLPVPGRSLIATTDGIVAASQPLAARAGVQILERGGNAVDAAIAANAVMGLMEPTGNGVGGDLFVLFWDAKAKKLHGLNSSGWAPTGLTVEALAAKGITTMPQRGPYSVSVPGVVAGWSAMVERFARYDLPTLLAPAIHYAEQGFPVAEQTSGAWRASADFLKESPTARATFLPDGRGPRAGDVFRNPDLARTLRRIAERGRDGFYRGETADAIIKALAAAGATMTAADLSEFTAEWVEPIKTTYRGWSVYEIPPQGQGIAALMMLNLMERYPLGEYGFHSPQALHVMIEAKKLAYADMLHYVGDPRFTNVPVASMLDKNRAVARAKLIDADKASCQVTPAELSSISNAQGNDTIYLTTVDRDGNIVSLIQSNYSGFGSGIVPAGMGFMLQNRAGLFTLERGRPNTLEPRKRPLHTIIPAFMEKDDVRIGFGIMGGWNQAQAHAQFVANIVDYGMTMQQALEAGRFTKGTFEGCDLDIEELVPAPTRDALTKLGHVMRVRPRRTGTFGFGQAVMSRADGVHFGASEPRHDGAAIPEAAPVRFPAATPRAR